MELTGRGSESPFDQIRRHLRDEVVSRRVRRFGETYTVNTRRTIEKALRNLEELADEAHTRATAKYQPTEVRQKWARVEAYIYQTVNGLTKTRDNQEIKEKLEELTCVVNKLVEEDREPGEEG